MAAKAVRPQYLRLCAGDLISTATASAADASNAGFGYMAVMVLRIRNKQEQQPFVGTPCAWSSLTSQVTQQRDLLQLITNVVGNDSVSSLCRPSSYLTASYTMACPMVWFPPDAARLSADDTTAAQLSEAALSPEANRRSSFSSLICNTRSSRSL
mgnify:CR=1 FL=1